MTCYIFDVPDALTSGVSLFLTKTTMVMRVRTIPSEERQMGMMANTELQDMYWIWVGLIANIKEAKRSFQCYLNIKTGRLIVIGPPSNSTISAGVLILHVLISKTIITHPAAGFSLKHFLLGSFRDLFLIFILRSFSSQPLHRTVPNTLILVSRLFVHLLVDWEPICLDQLPTQHQRRSSKASHSIFQLPRIMLINFWFNCLK